MAIDREATYGQTPNRIKDVDTFLSLKDELVELNKQIDSLGRSLTNNERRVKMMNTEMIRAIENVQKSGNKNLTKDQAAELKYLIGTPGNNNYFKYLEKLVQYNKAGLALNDRNDKSWMMYASFSEKILNKIDKSMERQWKEQEDLRKAVNTIKTKVTLPTYTVPSTGSPTGGSGGGLGGPGGGVGAGAGAGGAGGSTSFINNIINSIKPILEKTFDAIKNAVSSIFSSVASFFGFKKGSKGGSGGASSGAGAGSGGSGGLLGLLDSNLFKDLGAIFGSIPVIGKVLGLASKSASGAKAGSSIGKLLSFLPGPIGAIAKGITIIGAVMPLIGAIYARLKKSSPVLQAVSNMIDLAWNLLWMPLGNALGTFLLPMAEHLINFAIAFNQLFTDFSMENLMNIFVSAYQIFWGLLVNFLTAFPNMIINHILNQAIKLADAFGLTGVVSLLTDAKTMIAVSRDTLINLPTKIWDAIKNGWHFIQSLLIAGIKGIIQGVIDFFSNPVDKLAPLVTKILSGLTSVLGSILDVGGDILGKIGGMLGFATGGIVTSPTIAMVGEAGPEAIIPLDQLGAFGGGSYVININGDVYGVSDLETRIERAIQRTANKSYYR